LGIFSCGGGKGDNTANLGEGVSGPYVTGDPWAFRGAGIIGENKYLIGGAIAMGRTGDVLLQNDKIRLVIQKPRRNAGVALYGGNIIDADITRGQGEAGHDHFGITFPLINISWTPFYKKLEILNADFANGPVIVRASGVLDVYDYIQTSIIVPFAKITKGYGLSFPNQYNDVLNPFSSLPALKKISTTVVTDYILRSDRNYVIMQTHLFNSGDKEVPFPIGDWVNGSGTLETFIPGIGYTGQGLYDTLDSSQGAPAVIYPAMETDVGVSYGYFYDPTLFTKADGTINKTALLTVSGVSIMPLGEEKLAPTGLIPVKDINEKEPKINFNLPPGETTYVRYFAVGTGDAGSVMSGGFQALGIPTYKLAGTVVDAIGNPVANAKVLVVDNGGSKKTVGLFYSRQDGTFSGDVSTGVDNKAKLFGSGNYTVHVYKEGYSSSAVWSEAEYKSLKDEHKAGVCNTGGGTQNIQCVLGQSGIVQVTAKDENGRNVPARIAVVGFDPSPYGRLPRADVFDVGDSQSLISDIEFQAQQYAYMDTLFLDPSGQISNVGHSRYAGGNAFRLEPGEYEIFVMRGPEYSLHAQRVTINSGGSVQVNATLRKVVDTSGYISGDFHIHGINSPDSPFGQRARVNFALAEGLDLMVAADHDAVTDYGIAIREMGVSDYVASITGMEVTPMAFGHFNVFPILFDPSDPTGGAFDYTKKDGYTPGPDHHELLSPGEFLSMIDEKNPGEQVLQVNHIQDNTLGNFALSELVTTTKFPGVAPLSTFADPVEFRLSPNTNNGGNHQAPFPYGTNKLFTDKFTSMEICIGESAVVPFPHVRDTALPTWFNLLNLGKIATATCSSDTHRQIREPIGILRNYILSSADPRDGDGQYIQIDPQEIARNVNRHHVIVSAGPFVSATMSAEGKTAMVGDTLSLAGGGEKTVNLQINVQSPDWMDWDTVEVYVNTDPTPAKDDLSGPWAGTAKEFVSIGIDKDSVGKPSIRDNTKNHLEPKYLYAPNLIFKRGGGGGAQILTQSVSNGARTAVINQPITLTEDSWIVVLVKGSDQAHTIFPYAPKAVNTQGDTLSPAHFLDTLDAQRATTATISPSPDVIGGSKAFAFTNPILVDIDGNGWQAKYVRSGQSPLH